MPERHKQPPAGVPLEVPPGITVAEATKVIEGAERVQFLYDRLLTQATERVLSNRGIFPADPNYGEIRPQVRAAIDRDETNFLMEMARFHYEIEELKRQNTRNRLTGLANKEFAEKIFVSLQTNPKKSGATVVVRFDVDGFKKINDTLGHQAGDETLKEVAQQLNAELQKIRPTDVPIHFSGDEFGMILTDVVPGQGSDGQPLSLPETVKTVLKRILLGIEKISVPPEVNPSGYLTASAGFTIVEKDNTESFTTIANQADQAALRSKKLKFIPTLPLGSDRIVDASDIDALLKTHNITRADLEESAIRGESERFFNNLFQGLSLTTEERAQAVESVEKLFLIRSRARSRQPDSDTK